MDQVTSVIKSVLQPVQSLYNNAFNANKYAAGIGLSVIITTALFFVMVILISLGDSGMKEDTSVKLADVVMPERQIDTFMTEVEKPEQPEEQPEDIAQPDSRSSAFNWTRCLYCQAKSKFQSWRLIL